MVPYGRLLPRSESRILHFRCPVRGPQATLDASGVEPLTVWLHKTIQALAGRGPEDPPLTAGLVGRCRRGYRCLIIAQKGDRAAGASAWASLDEGAP
jgi:hypothetical protein